MMKIPVMLIFISFAAFLYADDGTWSSDFHIDGGPIYSVIENPDIQLEKEVIVFDGPDDNQFGKTDVYFLFNNTKDSQITLEAGFPVQISLPIFKYSKDISKPGVKYFGVNTGKNDMTSGKAPSIILSLFKEARNYASSDPENPDMVLVPEEIGKKRELISIKDFTDKFSGLVPFKIGQDGKAVDITSVLIESDFSSTGTFLVVKFHFKHSLVFPKNTRSNIDVEYSHLIIRGSTRDYKGFVYSYQWDYIIGTGRTWKDAIKNCYLITDEPYYEFYSGYLPKQFALRGIYGTKMIYGANNYEPSIDDVLSFSFNSSNPAWHGLLEKWFTNPTYISKPAGPKQPFVKVVGASSFLSEKTAIYTEKGIIKDIDFAPQNLFDGIRESAWCENVKGSGIGEWVEFELSKDITGINIQNGFNKSLYDVMEKDIGTYFGKNNRIKTLDFVSKNGTMTTSVNLLDTKDLQFVSIKLKKGIYRLTIKDVYKGTAWDDTCLGELTFIDSENDPVSNDDFLKSIFMRK